MQSENKYPEMYMGSFHIGDGVYMSAHGLLLAWRASKRINERLGYDKCCSCGKKKD